MKWFLITAVATTVTGFFFPFHGITPAIILAIIKVRVLAITIFARYSRELTGPWRWIYVVAAMAPTQTESPFRLTQLVVLAASILLAIVAVIRFHPERAHAF